MRSQGKLVGILLIGAAIVIGVAIVAWLVSGTNDNKIDTPAAIFGFILGFGVVVLPLAGFGVFLLYKGIDEASQQVEIDRQRKLMDTLDTQGQISISDLVFELDSSRDQVEGALRALVGRGLFTGYVDWKSGMLYSVEASQLEGRHTCPNCGGELELAGKGVIGCPYCGADIFLDDSN